MLRLLIYAAVLISAVLLLMRVLLPPRGKGGKPRGPLTRPGPDTVVCAECGTRYSPTREGWTCPGCGK
jgi:hypothetical protein